MVGGSFKVELPEPPMAVDCEIDHVNSLSTIHLLLNLSAQDKATRSGWCHYLVV
jgi:hypothetical protein